MNAELDERAIKASFIHKDSAKVKAHKLELLERKKRILKGIFTKFIFVYPNSIKKEIVIDRNVDSYMNLQFEISYFMPPKSLRNLYIIENENGNVVT